MAGTTVNKPRILQHAKTIHRPFITYVCVENFNNPIPNSLLIVDAGLDPVLATAGRNSTPVPKQASPDIDTEGIVINAGENRTLVYQSGSQNVIKDILTQEEVYARVTEIQEGGFKLDFYTLDDTGTENPYTLESGNYDFFIPYRFTFEQLPDDAMIRVKSKRVNDDASGTGGWEVMEVVTINALNDASPLTFSPISGSSVWGHVDGHSIDSMPGGAFSVAGKVINWDPTVANYDLETSDRLAVHYETYDLQA
jgi:hypothetical protein